MKSYTITENDAGQRLDKFLTKAVPRLPQSQLYKYLRIKRVKCNHKRCEPSYKLQVGDLLELYINDDYFDEPDTPLSFLRAPSKISVVYEDSHVLLADKPCGMLVHEDDEEKDDTLIHRIQHYLYAKGQYHPEEEHSFAPALCNRIDRNTSGIVIAAKDAASLRVLNDKIKNRELQKLYLCIVLGHLDKKEDTLLGYHTKDAETNTVKILPYKTEGAKTALTQYRVLDENRRYSLVEVNLLTGRTHQIRAHMASIGHPLLGDTKYGLNRDSKGTGYRFQALCSYKLAFRFTTPAEHLDYLNGRTFQLEDCQLLTDFYGKLAAL